MDINQVITQAEGRRLEFKAELPMNSDLAKTVVAFANDAGGDIYIGVSDEHQVVGLEEERLPQIEEQINNLIYDRCYPAILPDITFLMAEDKHVLRVHIYKGSTPPYYLKSEGKLKGTYIRVGSNNRLADESILGELERKRRNISFDGEMVMEKELTELDITGFKKMFKEKTQEELDLQTLRKLDLVKTEQEREYPTRALVLFADDELRRSLFPYAKIECARFKGTTVDEFIDQKTIDCQLGLQAEEAYNFVLRHINKGAKVEGVYTIYRWEYPIKAIREIIRNAVVHRQYSLTGKDIKIAIYDDMVEITSPGLLPPSIDYSAMNSRQSDARNKVIAGVFKHLGIIDQWGNGLKLVAEEMKQYPHIELKWREVGLSFQVQFVNKAFGGDVGDIGGGDVGDVGDVGDAETLSKVLQLIKDNAIISASEIADILKLSRRQCERVIAKLKKRGILEREGNTRTGRWIIRQA
jgi:predicted HTH transcriptional regulator